MMSSNNIIAEYLRLGDIAHHFSNLNGVFHSFNNTYSVTGQDRMTYTSSQLIPNESVSLVECESMAYPIVALGERDWIVAETQISKQEDKQIKLGQFKQSQER
jgi:hypothetical protein